MIKTLSWQVKLSFGLLIFSLCLLGAVGTVSAEEATATTQIEILEDIGVETSDKPVSNFKVFWNNIRDNVSLSLTFDPVKKAEKELKYAEKRIRWANTLAELDDDKAQKKALQLSARADEYMVKIEEKKEKLLENMDDRASTLIENIAKHQSNKMLVWDKLEAKIPVERLESFSAIREKVEDHEKRFLENLLEHEKVPEMVKEKLEEKQAELEFRIDNRQGFIQDHKMLLERIREDSGERFEEAKEILEQNRVEMKAMYQERAIRAVDDFKGMIDGEIPVSNKPFLDVNNTGQNSTKPMAPSGSGVVPGYNVNTEVEVHAQERMRLNVDINNEEGIGASIEIEPSVGAPNPRAYYEEVKIDYKEFLNDLSSDSAGGNR